jgi:hypothetical protein
MTVVQPFLSIAGVAACAGDAVADAGARGAAAGVVGVEYGAQSAGGVAVWDRRAPRVGVASTVATPDAWVSTQVVQAGINNLPYDSCQASCHLNG